MKSLMAMLALLLTSNAIAAEQRLAIYGGITQSGKTSYSAPSSGLSYRNGDDSAKASANYGAEYTYQSDSILGGSILVESTALKNGDGSKDQFTAFMVAPRVEARGELFGARVNLFGAFGVGPMLNVYNQSAANSGTTLIVNKTSNNTSLAFSPRIGGEIYLSPTVFIGVQAAYTFSTQTLNLINTDVGVNTSSTQAVSRHWIATDLRVGFSF